MIQGHSYEMLTGSRAQVYHGTAYKTTGGLTRSNLHKNKHGRFVSLSKFRSAKRENRLRKYGYTAKKGKFGAVKIGSTTRSRKGSKSRKMRGGHFSVKQNLDPASY
jgi:hypothetical protein